MIIETDTDAIKNQRKLATEQYIFGVDLGGTTVKHGLFTVEGRLIDKWEIPTRSENKGENLLPDIAASVKEAMARHSIAAEQLKGIGLGVPGAVSKDRYVAPCVNLNGWGGDVAGGLSALCGGVIVGGRLVSGAHGAGGEIGHIKVNDGESKPCGCGKRGCLEQYASATGILREARRRLAPCTYQSFVVHYPKRESK